MPKTKLDGGEETVSDGGYMAVFTNLKVLFAARRTTCVYAAKKQEMGHSRLVIVIFEKGAEEGEGSAHSILLHVPEKRRQR